MRKKFLFYLVTELFVSSIYSDVAMARCDKSGLISSKLITDVCWDCIFPIVISHIKLGGKDGLVPKNATKSYMCACPDKNGLNVPGIATSFWEPVRLVELETEPGCMSALDLRMGSSGSGNFGRIRTGTPGFMDGRFGDHAFYHYHFYSFPILEILDMFTGVSCSSDGYNDFDLMYMSELDPTWDDDVLAFFTSPEAVLTTNPVAAAACIADSVSIASTRKPIQELFWCAGSWGTLYPFSGHISMPTSTAKTSSLLTARVLAALHRRGFAMRTTGDDAMCKGVVDLELQRDQYKFSTIYPRAEANSDHVLGESVILWGGSRKYPGVAENPIYLVYRWHDCCNTLNLMEP